MSRFGRKTVPKARSPVPEGEALMVSDQKAVGSRTLVDMEKELTHSGLVCGVECASYTALNWGNRHDNEDRTMSVKGEFGKINFYTIGVLDGHDTEAASDFVSRQLPGVVSKHLKDGKPVELAYLVAMSEVEDMLKSVCATAGTCICSCTVIGNYVWCANLGDCRAGLVSLEVPECADAPTKAVSLSWLSRDHKASAPEERRRIVNLGGMVTNGRVEGLEPTRTLGDFDVKLNTKPGVISIEPDVRCQRLGEGGDARARAHQSLLVLATDGVWDVISGQDICDLIHARKEIAELQVFMARNSSGRANTQPLRDLAEDLVQFAIARGSRDDCTAVVALISAVTP